MSQSFYERYNSEKTWHGKVLVMEIFHLAMIHREKNWTLSKTAEQFGVSIGLVSENLRIALALHTNPRLIECESRQEVLKRMNGSYRRIEE